MVLNSELPIFDSSFKPNETMTTIAKVQEQLNKVFEMQDQLQKESWTKENWNFNQMREDFLSNISNILSETLESLREEDDDREYISSNER